MNITPVQHHKYHDKEVTFSFILIKQCIDISGDILSLTKLFNFYYLSRGTELLQAKYWRDTDEILVNIRA